MSIAEPERESFLYAKVSKAQKWSYIKGAKRSRMPLADWVKMVLDRAAIDQGEPDEDEDTKYNR